MLVTSRSAQRPFSTDPGTVRTSAPGKDLGDVSGLSGWISIPDPDIHQDKDIHPDKQVDKHIRTGVGGVGV